MPAGADRIGRRRWRTDRRGRRIIHEPALHRSLERSIGAFRKDRADLAGLLIQSLEGEPDEGVEAAWADEIERRVAQLEASTVKSIPWEEVRQRLLNRLDERRVPPGGTA